MPTLYFRQKGDITMRRLKTSSENQFTLKENGPLWYIFYGFTKTGETQTNKGEKKGIGFITVIAIPASELVSLDKEQPQEPKTKTSLQGERRKNGIDSR